MLSENLPVCLAFWISVVFYLLYIKRSTLSSNFSIQCM